MSAGFARPEAWPLLLAAPLAWILLRLADGARERRLGPLLAPRLVAGRGRRRLRSALFAGGLLLAALAAMHPVFGDDVADLEPRGSDLVVALDVSRSMRATDVVPDRLERAKREIRALAERAAGDRMGLVVFAGESRRAVPLTRDLLGVADLADLADTTSVSVGGTDLAGALEAAAETLGAARSADRVVLLLTDGEDLGGRGAEAARRLAAGGIVVHALGLGSRLGSKVAVEGARGSEFLRDRSGAEVVSSLDAEGLSRLAEATGGELVEAGAEPGALARLYEHAVLPRARESLAAEERRRREDRYQVPLLAALLLFLLDLALSPRGARAARPVPARAALLVGLAAAAGCGGPSPDRPWADALAALREGRLTDAASAASDAVEAGGPDVASWRDFLLGNVAFSRSEAAEADGALEPALAHAEDAVAFWQRAATSRGDDWPEARRNLERGLLRLERLRGRQGKRPTEDGGGSEERPGGDPREKPPLPPPPTPPTGGAEERPPDAPTPAGAEDLPAGRVLGLLDLLKAQERRKLEVRVRRRTEQGASVERDW